MNKKQKRLARCLCVQLLYSSELSNQSSDYDLNQTINAFFKNKDDDLDKIIYKTDEIDYANKLIDYVIKYKDTIDKLINQKLVNWEMHRLAIIDKIILRMCIAEMFYMEDIPPKVSMAEGIEIAKQFSTNDSSSFINGILDAIYNNDFKLEKHNKKELLDIKLKKGEQNTGKDIFGCTDIAASNYNPKATIDDGNCEY